MMGDMIVGSLVAALAVVELIYSYRTRAVIVPFLAIRYDSRQSPVTFWIWVALWTALLVGTLFRLVMQ